MSEEHRGRPRWRRGRRKKPWLEGEGLDRARQRANYLLHVRGWSVAQIAKGVGLPERAVRTLLTTRREWLERRETPP